MAKEKVKRDYNDPLQIWNEMAALDQKDYGFYDRLTEDQKKEFSPYILSRWAASVQGDDDLSKYYVMATNNFSNQSFWDLSKDKKIGWLSLCAISPGLGRQKHYWLGAPKRDSINPLKKLLMDLLPTQKISDIDLILKLKSKEEIILWLEKEQGIQPEILKKLK